MCWLSPGPIPPGNGIAGTFSSVTTPAVVIRPTFPVTPVNQSAPSGPAVIDSDVASVPAVPGAIPPGAESGHGELGHNARRGHSAHLAGLAHEPERTVRSRRDRYSVAALLAVPAGDPAAGGIAGTANSVTTPAVVIRPISPGTPPNQGPVRSRSDRLSVAGVLAVPAGDPAGGGTTGTANSVTTPVVVIRPTFPGMPVNQSAPSGPVMIALGSTMAEARSRHSIQPVLRLRGGRTRSALPSSSFARSGPPRSPRTKGFHPIPP